MREGFGPSEYYKKNSKWSFFGEKKRRMEMNKHDEVKETRCEENSHFDVNWKLSEGSGRFKAGTWGCEARYNETHRN